MERWIDWPFLYSSWLPMNWVCDCCCIEKSWYDCLCVDVVTDEKETVETEESVSVSVTTRLSYNVRSKWRSWIDRIWREDNIRIGTASKISKQPTLWKEYEYKYRIWVSPSTETFIRFELEWLSHIGWLHNFCWPWLPYNNDRRTKSLQSWYYSWCKRQHGNSVVALSSLQHDLFLWFEASKNQAILL